MRVGHRGTRDWDLLSRNRLLVKLTFGAYVQSSMETTRLDAVWCIELPNDLNIRVTQASSGRLGRVGASDGHVPAQR